MQTPTFDHGPLNVKGENLRGEKARVLWFPEETGGYGTLVVLLSRKSFQRATTTKPAKVKDDRWVAVTRSGQEVRLDSKDCACGWTLKELPARKIWELANGERSSIDLKSK